MKKIIGDLLVRCIELTLFVIFVQSNAKEVNVLSHPELRERGTAYFEELFGDGAADALVSDMAELCPDFTLISIEWAMGGIATRPGLDRLTRELVVIAACATLGHPVIQLRAHTQAALRAGATREQIVECILQLTFYAGAAVVRNSLVHIKDILLSDGCERM